ncbi:MAG: radical SAM protein [bacterium]|nr:radical SAM protein [bacterium]
MKSHTYLSTTLSFCTRCNKVEQARIVSSGDGVYMERICEKNGIHRVKLAACDEWYRQRMRMLPQVTQIAEPGPSKQGCPLDCEVCQWHTNGLRLPVFSITNDCNLDCPKCFTFNRPDKKYFKSVEETRQIIRHIVKQSGGVQLINLTGGEPTLHPQLFEILEACKHEKIQRITMNTNGLRLAEDETLAEKLKDAGVQLVLSLDTLNPDTSKIIHGADITAAKRKALDIVEKLDIPTTILHVCIKGINHTETADIVSRYIKKDFVKSITIQNMTYTGKNGSQFEPREHITLDEVENLLNRNEAFSPGDFFTPGAYHPLCYSVAYYVVSGEKPFPLVRLLGRDVLRALTAETYYLDPERDFSQPFADGLNRLWAEGEDEEMLMGLKRMLSRLYPSDRQLAPEERRELIEKNVKMICIHPHMDEDNFDIDQVSRCGDLVPDETGTMVPACSYNLLYRQKDSRFWEVT